VNLGVPVNPYALNVPTQLRAAAARLGVTARPIDLPTVIARIGATGAVVVADRDGPIAVDGLAPYLLFGYPAATYAFRMLDRQTYLQNPVDGVLAADDKAATAGRLAEAGLPQVPTVVCPSDLDLLTTNAGEVGYPVVVKRTHGAQGRWVRRADDPAGLKAAFDELMADGPTALILQPEVVEARGRSIRVVVTGARVLAVTERTAGFAEWRSNIAGGANQRPVDLSTAETEMALGAARALELRHAGIDLLRTAQGSVVLEVNACPDFTSMMPYFGDGLADAVVQASLREN
jgi:ribosomal protein S6--L-glutamate ligase